jgi:hypothetical protein
MLARRITAVTVPVDGRFVARQIELHHSQESGSCPSRARPDGQSRSMAVKQGHMNRAGPAIEQVTDPAVLPDQEAVAAAVR